MSKLRAFLIGVSEFRHAITMHFDDYELLLAYDTGRELAHRLTFRFFEV